MKTGKIKKAALYGLAYILIKWSVILIIGGTLYKTGYWNNWYLTAIPVIGITVFLVRQKISKNKKQKTYVDN